MPVPKRKDNEVLIKVEACGVNRPDVLGITVNTTSLTNDPDFNYIHEEASFKYDDNIQDHGKALSQKINEYVALLNGKMPAGAEVDTK